MFHRLPARITHYLLLLLTSAVLFFPNLGGPSLWDIDEGNNATCAWEMMEADNGIVPTFNGELRVDKPALLYWLQIGAYKALGVNEYSARLPSALAALVAVLLTYELARRLFDAATGLLAGVILASSVMFCAAAHFANPDALLNACTTLTFLFFWRGYERGHNRWLIGAGASAGLAVLAKGPVGLALPGLVIFLFLLWARRLPLLFNRHFGWGVLAFLLVASPWYVRVGVDTRGQFLRGFLFRHNFERFGSPMENHRGPIFYYLLVLAAGLVPWSVFLGPSCWYGFWSAVSTPWTRLRGLWLGAAESQDGVDGIEESTLSSSARRTIDCYRFLACWIVVYVVFFSVASTKLPNYILPVYAPCALLTARFLERWRRGLIQPPAWVVQASLICLALAGSATVAGLLLAGGTIEVPWLRGRAFPGLEHWAWLGLVPLGGAVAGWFCFRQGRSARLVALFGLVAVIFTGGLFAGAADATDSQKAPRYLAYHCQLRQPTEEIRVACYEYFQPSLVFYAGRQVPRCDSEAGALAFLEFPLPAYLVLPEAVWGRLEAKVAGPHRVLGRHRDFYVNADVIVVTNR
jgi:4-amino-4-deoxy-L-arabinose transferase-like glycosyltransferase